MDFDVLDFQVTENVIPHFRGIASTMSEHGREYKIGIYAPRNVCSRVAAAGLSSASFVSDMSTGYSGNLGFPLAADWAFDQIATVVVGTGEGAIEIDKNVSSAGTPGRRHSRPHRPRRVWTWTSTCRDAPPSSRTSRPTWSPSGCPRAQEPARTRVHGPDNHLLVRLDHAVRPPADKSRANTVHAGGVDHLSDAVENSEAQKRQDGPADDAVRLYHAGYPGLQDCSTGLGQIFARTAIDSRDYCIDRQIIGGTSMDPTSDEDIWAVWQKLNGDDFYNVNTVPSVLIAGAAEVALRRIELDYTDAETVKALARYNGFGHAAANHGRQLTGL